MTAVMWWFAVGYAFGRLGRVFIFDRERRRKSIAHLRGVTLRRAFAALGACFVKLGQVLSSRPDLLDPEIIEELRKLQDKMPAFKLERVRTQIEADLGGSVGQKFAELDEIPIAAASVAQVHRGKLSDGTEVAVKVLRPDVREKVERDSAILINMAKMIAWHPTWRLSDPVGHLRHFVAGIFEQTDLRRELAHYERFHKNFADAPGVCFPRVFAELSGERVMTMTFVRGQKIDSLPPGNHAALARRLQQAVLKMCFVDGFFHADLHPGNVLRAENGDLCLLDVGLVKEITPEILVQFMDLTKCVAMGNANDFMNHIRKFHTYMVKVDWAGLERDVVAFVARFRSQNIGELEMGSLMNELFAIARHHRVHPLPDLALVLVGLVTAEGIGKQLDPGNNLFQDVAVYIMPLLATRGLVLDAPAVAPGAPPVSSAKATTSASPPS